MPDWRPSDIGPLYDFALSTRDGSLIDCLDAHGNPQKVSRMAFMCSTDRNYKMSEATELQEKSTLTQLATTTTIDREFEQWVQNTQGDWSSGVGQKIYGAQGNSAGYYDGQGLIWPLNDTVPQVPFAHLPIQAPANSGVAYSGVAGGFLIGEDVNIFTTGNGYVTAFRTATGAGSNDRHIRFTAGDKTWDYILNPGSTALVNILAICVAYGAVWVLYQDTNPSPTNVTLLQLAVSATVAGALEVVQSIVLESPPHGAQGANEFAPRGWLAAAPVGNRAYLAIGVQMAETPIGAVANFQTTIYVYDFTVLHTPTSTSIVLPAISYGSSSGSPAGIGMGLRLVSMAWQGSNLFLSVTDGYTASIMTTTPPFTSFSTVAVLPGLANALMASVGAALFIIAWSGTSLPGGNGDPNIPIRVDILSLAGGTLVEIGPLPIPVVPLIQIGQPVVFDSYAFFPIVYKVPGATTQTIAVYAYDVVRARLFRALTVTNSTWTAALTPDDDNGPGPVNLCAVYGATSHTYTGGGTYFAQFGLVIYTGDISAMVEVAREYYWGVQPITPTPNFKGLLQLGAELISGLIDFTAGSNKLYRQVVVSFFGGLVVGQSSPNVTLNVWFDQDPAQLAAVPDQTASISGATEQPQNQPPAPLPQQLKLPTNRIARKLVYDVISIGGGFVGGIWQNAAKIVSVAVQAATGWVWDIVIDLSPNVKTNRASTQDYAYQNQSVPNGVQTDHVVAYNFIKGLWRLKGGECVLTLANLDSYNALLQVAKFESPKPFASAMRSDQLANVQWIGTLKIREDI